MDYGSYNTILYKENKIKIIARERRYRKIKIISLYFWRIRKKKCNEINEETKIDKEKNIRKCYI